MADEARTPVAIRISRPFGSEEEFLQHELDTLTRTTIMLLGAQSRPQGVVLRFEVALASGDALIRGEGRVVGFRPAGQGVDSGLTLRFTRLDARSKALVDRAAAQREARARASLHPPRPADAAPPSPPERPAPVSSDLEVTSVASVPSREEPARPVRHEPPPLPPAARARTAPPPLPAHAPGAPMILQHARREELLDRLRQRAKALSPAAIEQLLASRAKRA